MNHGKICVSVCAKTADKLIEQIKRAEDLADVIEIRFDCLDDGEFDLALQKIDKIKGEKPFLATFRPKGGFEEFTFSAFVMELSKDSINQDYENRFARLESRINNWKPIFSLDNVKLLDFEMDLFLGLMSTKFFENEVLEKHQIIVSDHDFEGVPDYLEELYEEFSTNESGIKCDILKIAVQTNDITDSIPIWQLLQRAKSENKEIIPIAMGESGKWTRILGLAHGAFMTYSSLDSDKETAPGQVTAQDLIEVYRAKELDETTDVYGILGSNTSVSMSPYIHNTAFKFHKLNAVFVPLQVHDLDEFMRRMVKPETREIDLNFKGFSVTIPHKQSIIKHLDFWDKTAREIGAVNTVKIVNGKLHGYNTDAQGFIEPLKKAYGDLSGAKVAILGAGGAARACVYALKQNGANVTIFEGIEVRSSEFKSRSFDEFDVIVNATPLGMRGKAESETPLSAKQMKGVKLVYDLVYIPQTTEFIKEAKSLGIPTIGGLEMLLVQAVEQQRIWTELDSPIVEIREVVLKKLG